MSTTVTYKGQTLTTVENQTKTLNTAGTWVEDDFTLTDVTASGGGGLFEKLYETTTTEDVKAITIDMTQYVSSYDMFFIYAEGELVTNSFNWLYWHINSTATTDPYYGGRQKEFSNKYLLLKRSDETEYTFDSVDWGGEGYRAGKFETPAWADIQTFNLIGYSANIKAGAKVEVWGGSYASL